MIDSLSSQVKKTWDIFQRSSSTYEGYRLAIECQKTCRAEEKCNTCKTENHTKLDQSEPELPIELLSDCITYNLIEHFNSKYK